VPCHLVVNNLPADAAADAAAVVSATDNDDEADSDWKYCTWTTLSVNLKDITLHKIVLGYSIFA